MATHKSAVHKTDKKGVENYQGAKLSKPVYSIEADTKLDVQHQALVHDSVTYEGGSKSSRKSAAKLVIVFGNLRSLCIL